MSTSQVLDRTFQLYRKNFFLFAGISVPAAILTTAVNMFHVPQGVTGIVFGIVASLATPMIGEAIASGATAHAVSAVHLNQSISIVEAYRRLRASFANILGAVVLVNIRALWVFVLAAALGALAAVTVPPLMILAVLTGIVAVVVACVAYCFYALAVPACAVEHLSPRQSLVRSRFLTDGIGKQIVVIYILGALMSLLASAVLHAPQYVPSRFGHPALLTGVAATLWSQLASFLAYTVADPVMTIAFCVLYYDQRVRKEAFDLEQMIQAIEQAPSPAPATAPTSAQ